MTDYPPLVATNWSDSVGYPVDFVAVHAKGIPHRGVHVEVVNETGAVLVWSRADGRLEIAPAGHLDWIVSEQRAETSEEGALRETEEELCLQKNWDIDLASVYERLRSRITHVTKVINQIPSSHGSNNEWVTIFRLHWDMEEWLDPVTFQLSNEGNTCPRWMPFEALVSECVENPMGINSALRLFLARRGVMIPIHLAPSGMDR